LGELYIEKGRYDEAEEILKEGLEKFSNQESFYITLGELYIEKGRYDEAEEILKEGLEKNPDGGHFRVTLGELYIEKGRYDEAEYILKEGIKNKSNEEDYYFLLSLVYKKRLNEINFSEGIYKEIDFKDKKIENLFEENSVTINLEERKEYGMFSDITKYHYNELYKELDKRDIKYIAMQYPTLDINDLKMMFDGDEELIFVSNKANFEKALSEGDYWDYFIDKFTGGFGHCTSKGNRLIAENVASFILKELNIKECE
jgi:tetratricopeptide (TPR) repeat protein